MRLVFRIAFLVLLISEGLHAQDQVMSLQEYLGIVKKHHPIARKASLVVARADAGYLQSKAGFDPTLEGDFYQKSFDDKNYWREGYGYLKIPTWYAIDIKAGYERNDGQFLSRSDFLPPRGLWDVGIEVSLGKGLLMDERRAVLLKAEIMQASSIQEQKIILNDLLYDASKTYLDWQMLYFIREITLTAQTIADQRLEQTKTAFFQGDKPAIDTLETFVALQSRQQLYLEVDLAYRNKKIELENYLWAEAFIPLEIDDAVIPGEIETFQWDFEVDSLLLSPESMIEEHPKLLGYQYKLSQLDIERKLINESFKPQLDIGFSPLVSTSEDSYFESPNLDDFKLSAKFKYPLFVRDARGKRSLNKVKQEESLLDLEINRQKINTSIAKNANSINNQKEQLSLIRESQDNYGRLLKAENRKFEIGESSIFLINSREQKFIQSQMKYRESQIKLLKSKIKLFYVTAKMDLL